MTLKYIDLKSKPDYPILSGHLVLVIRTLMDGTITESWEDELWAMHDILYGPQNGLTVKSARIISSTTTGRRYE